VAPNCLSGGFGQGPKLPLSARSLGWHVAVRCAPDRAPNRLSGAQPYFFREWRNFLDSGASGTGQAVRCTVLFFLEGGATFQRVAPMAPDRLSGALPYFSREWRNLPESGTTF
jgi:hypothetical protein